MASHDLGFAPGGGVLFFFYLDAARIEEFILSHGVVRTVYRRDPDIYLADLLRSLWGSRLLIVTCVSISLVLAVGFLLQATPEYEVRSYLHSAQLKELDELNVSGVYKLSSESALRKVGATLHSYETRLDFFQANRELFVGLSTPGESLEQSFERFNRDGFSMLRPEVDPKGRKELSDFVGIQLRYPATVDGVAIVNGLVEYAIEVERQRIAADVQMIIDNRLKVLDRTIKAARANYEAGKAARIAQLEETDNLKRVRLLDELKALRQQLQAKRLNRIAQLDEAIAVAAALKILRPTTPAALGENGRTLQGSGSMVHTEINNQQIPLYFMGTQVLEAERAVMRARQSDDFAEPRISEIAKELQLLEVNRQVEVLTQRTNEDLFLKPLVELREKEAELRSINLDLSSLAPVQVDQLAVMPLKPVHPKSLLILTAALICGLVLGIILALVRMLFEPLQSVATGETISHPVVELRSANHVA